MILFKFLLGFFELYLLLKFAGCFFIQKEKQKLFIIFLSGLVLLSDIANIFYPDNYINLFLSVLLTFLAFCPYKGGIAQKIFIGCIYIAWNMLLEFGVVLCIGGVYGLDELSGVNSGFLQFYCLILSYLFKFIFVYLLSRKFKDAFNRADAKAYILQAIIPLLCMGSMLYFTNYQLKSEVNYKISYVAVVIFAVLIVLSFIIFNITERMYAYRQTAGILDKQLELAEFECSQLTKHQREIREIKHNIKNVLIPFISMLPSSGPGSELSELSDLYDKINSGWKHFTDNEFLNAVLNNKYAEAVNQGIDFTINLSVPPILKLSAGEIGILYGCVLDNAMEACVKCPAENRYIKLFSVYRDGNLIIHAENSTLAEVKNLYTSKADPVNHGMGLRSIDYISTKYHGGKDINISSNKFEIGINLYGV